MKRDYTDIYNKLIDNDLFLEWVYEPTDQLNEYWNNYILTHNGMEEPIKTLKDILKKIKVKEPIIAETDKVQVWNNINRQKRKKTRKRNLYLRIAGVAACFLCLFSISYLFFNQNKIDSSNINYLEIISQINDTITNRDKVTLKKGNDKVNVIDNGVLIYKGNGDVSIGDSIIRQETNKDPILCLDQLVVPYGRRANLTFSDGTRIWINSGTKLIYPTIFNEKYREIFVEGEIFISVAKDDNKPFIVKTENTETVVLGTQFNVSAYKNSNINSVVLVNGIVKVKNKTMKEYTKMLPSQIFNYDVETNKFDVKYVDVTQYIAWKDGYLILVSDPLDQVMSKLERYYNIRVFYELDSMKKIKVSGKLDLKDNIESVVKNIALTVPITYEIKDNNLIIKAKK